MNYIIAAIAFLFLVAGGVVVILWAATALLGIVMRIGEHDYDGENDRFTEL